MKVISVENVWKKFILARDRPKDLADAARGLFRRTRREDFWALKDISFDVEQGEALGIIGHNGAGKSTLLKLLTRIMEPTKGRVRTRGRISALIEVGAGFHQEMTGRENIYLNGSILGMTRAEIDRKFDEIVAFAGLEAFIDMPVKRYSSGMYARLGFAIAAHVEPEILIVDEVLAVGDAAFQRKCINRMDAVRQSEGVTVLFVSHNMVAIQNLCKESIWLRQGTLVERGPSREVVAHYLGSASEASTECIWEDPSSAPGTDDVRLRRACVKPELDTPAGVITTETPIVLEFEYWNMLPNQCLNVSLHLFNEDGVRLFNTSPSREPVWHGKPFPVGLFKSVCHIPGNLLNDGRIRVQLLFVRDRSVVIHKIDNVLTFDVIDAADRRGGYLGRVEGAVRPILDWETELIQRADAVDAVK